MPEHNLFRIFISRLEKYNIPYIVTGAVASVIYGEPRLTHDIDLVVELDDKNAQKIIDAFPSEEFYCPPIEVIKLEARRQYRGHFNLIHQASGFKADIYLKGKDDLHKWAFTNKKKVEVDGKPIWLSPPEYVILRKLEYFRDGQSGKHLEDIKNILEVSGEQIDKKQLEEKIRAYGLEKEWKKVVHPYRHSGIGRNPV
jgi:hypothetical protein